jgi:hypothetical protein
LRNSIGPTRGRDDLSLVLVDPAALVLWIARLDECSGDLRNQRLESHVPTVLLRIEDALAMDGPADVATYRRRIGPCPCPRQSRRVIGAQCAAWSSFRRRCVVRDSDTLAKLRLLYVEPSARDQRHR